MKAHTSFHKLRTMIIGWFNAGIDIEQRHYRSSAMITTIPKRSLIFIALAARTRRQRGLYDLLTLRLFRFLWLRSRSPHHLLAYLSFRRDLGYPLSANKASLLLKYMNHLRGRSKFRAKQLLAEVNFFTAPSSSNWQKKQGLIRDEFIKFLQEQSNIVVLGNSSKLPQTSISSWIDQQGCVVRFNHCFGSPGIGKKLDIWVQSPSYHGPRPNNYQYSVISGPAMEYRLSSTPQSPAITVPLEIWRSLVRELSAPPSAGVLFLAWLKKICGDWQKVSIAGLGYNGTSTYHHALNSYQAGSRHHWAAESTLLQKWQKEGLRELGQTAVSRIQERKCALLFPSAHQVFCSGDYEKAALTFQDIAQSYPDLKKIAELNVELALKKLEHCISKRLPDIWWSHFESHPARRKTLRFPASQIERKTIWVLIPVYNAYDQVKDCLRSVEKYGQSITQVLVINDASSDYRITPLLESYTQKNKWLLVHHEHNLGYTRTINEAISLAGRADVVLLNSDCIVGPRWLENLCIAAYSDKSIATATPLSNAAGAFSAPVCHQVNPIAEHLTFEGMARALNQVSLRLYPEVPTGHGFCLYIKRQCLDEVGLMDEQAFPRAYGEENDFCQRAILKAWRHIIDDATYVYHHQSASFADEKQELIQHAQKVLQQRYPDYQKATATFNTAPKIQEVRNRLAKIISHTNHQRQAKPRTLYVLANRDGGTPLTNKDLMQALEEKLETFVLHSNRQELQLSFYYKGKSTTLEKAKLSVPLQAFPHRLAEYDDIIAGYLVKYGIEFVHIRHIAWHSLGLLEQCKRLGLRLIFSFHDFYTICPNIKLLDENQRYCQGYCSTGSGPCQHELWPEDDIQNLKGKQVFAWRKQIERALMTVDEFVTTSHFARALILEHFPSLSDRPFHIIEHGRDFANIRPIQAPKHDSKPLKVLVAGNLTTAKGGLIIQQLCQAMERDELDIHLLGSIIDPKLDLEGRITVHGPYERDDFVQRVEKIKPDIGFVPSIWPETYCHVLSEMWAAGLPVIGFNIGSVGERIRNSDLGWTIELNQLDTLPQYIRKICQYLQLPSQVLNKQVKFPSLQKMAQAYEAVYFGERKFLVKR